jgi:hypothetical protein
MEQEARSQSLISNFEILASAVWLLTSDFSSLRCLVPGAQCLVATTAYRLLITRFLAVPWPVRPRIRRPPRH